MVMVRGMASLMIKMLLVSRGEGLSLPLLLLGDLDEEVQDINAQPSKHHKFTERHLSLLKDRWK